MQNRELKMEILQEVLPRSKRNNPTTDTIWITAVTPASQTHKPNAFLRV